jgi:hypothetical protein
MNNRKPGFIRSAAGVMISFLIISLNYVQAGEADVLEARISAKGGGVYRIDTTVKHADAGWDHYANRWDVLDVDGNVLGSRVLAHPHDNEQPFTRSLTLNLPEGLNVVVIRAHDSVHGLGGATVELAVPK